MRILIVIAAITSLFFSLINAEEEFEQYRQLRCLTPDGLTKAGPQAAKCKLVLKDTEKEQPGRAAPTDDLGCFSEPKKPTAAAAGGGKKSKKGEAADEQQKTVLCQLGCPNASIWFHSPIEQGHKACFKGFGYGLEERDNEWYIWRADKCLNSTATFTVGCKWRASSGNVGLFRTKFPNDKALFTALGKSTENAKKNGDGKAKP